MPQPDSITLHSILVNDLDAVWDDGTLWWETMDILTLFEEKDLRRPMAYRDDTVYFLNPETGIELGGFALRLLSTSQGVATPS